MLNSAVTFHAKRPWSSSKAAIAAILSPGVFHLPGGTDRREPDLAGIDVVERLEVETEDGAASPPS